MKKLVVTLIVMLAFAVNADAQGFLGRLKDRAVNAAKNAVENKVTEKVSRETNDAVDGVLDGKKSKKNEESGRRWVYGRTSHNSQRTSQRKNRT